MGFLLALAVTAARSKNLMYSLSANSAAESCMSPSATQCTCNPANVKAVNKRRRAAALQTCVAALWLLMKPISQLHLSAVSRLLARTPALGSDQAKA